jgi:hypothetical protein
VSDANRRATKAERKEQARLEREEIRQRIARRNRNRTIGTVLVVVAVATVVIAFVVIPSDDEQVVSQLGDPADIVAQADRAATEASCEDVRTVDPYPGGDQTHVEDAVPDLSTYPSTPPASGPHEATTLPAGVYESPPAIGPLIHSLEHGASIVWYDPAAPQAEIDRITAFYEQAPGDVAAGLDRVIVAPYDYDGPAGSLPDGARMALVAWHRVRTCADPSLEVALDFTTRFSAPASLGRDYEGEAPEAGLPF